MGRTALLPRAFNTAVIHDTLHDQTKPNVTSHARDRLVVAASTELQGLRPPRRCAAQAQRMHRLDVISKPAY